MQKTTYLDGKTLCLNCGAVVHVAFTKDGNKYLGETAHKSIHGGHFSPAHRCDLYDVNDSSLGFQQRMIEEGEIIVGATVEVVKGRKVAKGTVGEVFWVGDNGFGVSVGLSLTNGEKVFTAIKNIESTIKLQKKEGK
jgi:hypothetical protein